jgi:hypothetical protein
MIKVTGVGAADHFIPLNQFKTDGWEDSTVKQMLPALHAEMARIFELKKYATEESIQYDLDYLNDGQNFQIFDKILSTDTKNDLINMIDSRFKTTMTFAENIENNSVEIAELASAEIIDFFNAETESNLNLFKKIKEFKTTNSKGLSFNQLITAFTVNQFLHNYNTLGLLYGDPALYNHAKQEFHKRNAGIGSTGTILRTDSYISKFLNSNAIYNNSYAAANAERLGITDDNKYVFSETMNTAVVQDMEITSVYYDSILKTFDGDEARAKAYRRNGS